MFEKRKERQAAEMAQRQAQDLATRQATWQQADQQLAQLVEWIGSVVQGRYTPLQSSVPLKAGEHAFYSATNIGLVEPRRGPGHYVGASQSVSVHVPGTKSMRYRVGGTRGTYVQGDEKPTVIDRGNLTVTTLRATFVGSKQSREWAWAKLIGFHDEQVAEWTGIAVSNRQKISGVTYSANIAGQLRMALELGVAVANGTGKDLLAQVQAERSAWQLQRPGGAGPPFPTSGGRTVTCASCRRLVVAPAGGGQVRCECGSVLNVPPMG